MRSKKLFLLLVSIVFLITQSSFAQYSQTIHLNYVSANRIEQALHRVIKYSQQVFPGWESSGSVGDYVTGTIFIGPGNGLTFRDVTVELISITGDVTNGSARLYIYDLQRDREVTLTQGNSELVDNYRVRVDKIDPRKQQADITIRLAGNGVGVSAGAGQHPPGRVIISSDLNAATVTITADYQSDLQNLVGWVQKWDVAANADNTDYSYQPPAYLLHPNQAVDTTGKKN